MQTIPQSGLPLSPHPPPPAGAVKPNLLAALTAVAPTHIKPLHAQILRRSNLTHPSTTPLLLRLLHSAPDLDYALSVFRTIPSGPAKIQLLNKFLRDLSRSDDPQDALELFEEMLSREEIGFDRFSFPPVLKASARVKGLGEGLEIHAVVAKLGYHFDPFIQTGLVGMYAACGRIMDARLLFDRMSYKDVVAWSIIIDGCCQSGLFDEAVKLFEEMKSSDVKPDEMLLSTILSACARSGNLTYGRMIHDYITENNLVVDPHLQSALISMYASSGCMSVAQQLFEKMSPKNLVVSTTMISWYSRVGQVENARKIFNQLDDKDLVCWSAMISGYVVNKQPQEALDLFKEMQVMGMRYDQATILGVISACAQLGVLNKAKWIHIFVDKKGFGDALPINNALIDMYAKCGSLDNAREVFEKIPCKNVISWTSMISASAMHGDAHSALRLFSQMKNENFEPNEITFIGVLYACSHAGLVKEGKEIFESMVNEHKIIPKLEHYGCMVDLFGRANLLREALEITETMPMAPNVVIWGSLMSACQVHGEIELGEFAAKQVLMLDPNHDGAHVLLSNVYAKERRWEEVDQLRSLMRERGISKERGCSRIESNNEVHEFSIGDRDHEQADLIYEKLDEVIKDLKHAGYTPSAHSVFVDLEDEEKKEVILWHSEKLALCYSLLSGHAGSCIRIVKNLRVCEDCHTFMKLASKVYGREIIVRDRFHHCKDGICSCKDYW